MNRNLQACLCGIALVASAGFVCAEEIRLTNGGQIDGKIDRSKSTSRTHVLETASGGRITLSGSQVHLPPQASKTLQEYEKRYLNYPNTVEGQWKLAEWCREHGLKKKRRVHLEQIVRLEPDHQKARSGLGHKKSVLDRRWVTHKQWMKEQGYFYSQDFQGKWKWRTQQEIEILKLRKQQKNTQKEWNTKIKRWNKWLSTKRVREARENILNIKDPNAVMPISQLLAKETRRAYKLLYIKALANIGSPSAILVLVARSLNDSDEEVRLTCLDIMGKHKPPAAFPIYIQALKSKDPEKIKWAAAALAKFGNKSAIEPLINALVTVQTKTIVVGNPGSTSATFSPDGGGTSFGGGSKTIIQKNYSRNAGVLHTLVQLTDRNFVYSIQDWRNWYTNQKTLEINARRD